MRIRLDVEKPAAGGWMIARHEGAVVLVAGAIPGERVLARITRSTRSVVYAEVEQVLEASPDRLDAQFDPRCGGQALAHIALPRQAALKAEILDDAFRRLARLRLPSPPEVVTSPAAGYRMRARFHVRGHRLGFLRESSHDLCDAAATGQLLPGAVAWVSSAMATLETEGLKGLVSVEMAENLAGTERAAHLELAAGEDPERYAPLAVGLAGLSAHVSDTRQVRQVRGQAWVVDRLDVSRGDRQAAVPIERDARAFFQGNRFLLEPLVSYVAALVPDGPVLDLYAGVGVFGLALAALGSEPVTLVEGNAVSSACLGRNASGCGSVVHVLEESVESFLWRGGPVPKPVAAIVDPPRTGLSPRAMEGLCRQAPPCIVYVSCDPATLARDARRLADAGYAMGGLKAFDLFPNTAHIEAVARFDRGQGADA